MPKHNPSTVNPHQWGVSCRFANCDVVPGLICAISVVLCYYFYTIKTDPSKLIEYCVTCHSTPRVYKQ